MNFLHLPTSPFSTSLNQGALSQRSTPNANRSVLASVMSLAVSTVITTGTVSLTTLVVPEIAQARSTEFVVPQGTLRFGDHNADVLAVQRALVDKEYLFIRNLDTATRGYFGPRTEAAVIAFQRDQGLEADGIVGSQTLALLFPETEETNPPSYEEMVRQFKVALMQEQLDELGYYEGPIDGQIGVSTQKALREFSLETLRRINLTANPNIYRATEEVDQEYAERRAVDPSLPSRGVLMTRVEASFPRPPIAQHKVTEKPNRSKTLEPHRISVSLPQSSPYKVIIPSHNAPDLIWRVREVVREAMPYSNERGDYIQAGAFRDRNSAQAFASSLRSDYSLNARVYFQR